MREVIQMSKANQWLINAHVADVANDQMCVRPAGAPGHPAWQLGHLCVVRGLVLKEFGVPANLPAPWTKLFNMGSEPTANAGDYPDKQTLLTSLRSVHESVLATVEKLPEQALEAPNPVASLRGGLPTLRMLLTLLLTTHDGYHIGQLAAWRAAMKLPRVL